MLLWSDMYRSHVFFKGAERIITSRTIDFFLRLTLRTFLLSSFHLLLLHWQKNGFQVGHFSCGEYEYISMLDTGCSQRFDFVLDFSSDLLSYLLSPLLLLWFSHSTNRWRHSSGHEIQVLCSCHEKRFFKLRFMYHRGNLKLLQEGPRQNKVIFSLNLVFGNT